MKDLFDTVPVIYNGNICLKKITIDDLEGIKKLILCDDVYRYVPTFVPEKQCNGDMEYFINTMCTELFDKKIEIILGIYYKYVFCGLFELYHYDLEKKQVSIGYRINKDFWNKGITSESLSLIIDYLFKQTDISTICASNMISNPISGRVLEKNCFSKIKESILEDWGYSNKSLVYKWTLKKVKNKTF